MTAAGFPSVAVPGDTGSVLPETALPDTLADFLDGRPHELASFPQGLAVAELVEAMLA